MKIGVDLDDVLRDFTGRFEEIYNKYEIENDFDGELDLTAHPMTEYDLLKTFPFPGGVDELNFFLYVEASLEVFGLGDEKVEHGITKLNGLNLDLIDDEEHSLVISSKEANNSIAASLFFLSKNGCKLPTIKFHQKPEDLWEDVDVLITANPFALDAKPEGKISIKVSTTYNVDTKSDYAINDIIEFTDNKELRANILSF